MSFYILKNDEGLSYIHRGGKYLRSIFKLETIRGLVSLENPLVNGCYTHRGIKLSIKSQR